MTSTMTMENICLLYTSMELYQAYTDYNGMMDLTEKLYRFVAQEVLGTTTITYKLSLIHIFTRTAIYTETIRRE